MELTTNLSLLRDNVSNLKAVLNKNTAFYFMVKGNAYNHGVIACALATRNIVDGYGVATYTEGKSLRELGISQPIIVTCPSPIDSYIAREYNLIVEVGNFPVLECMPVGSTIDIKADTGMHRQGFYIEEIPSVINICTSKHINIRGLATHFASKCSASKQLEQLYRFRELFSRNNIYPIIHYIATPTLRAIPTKGDLVRIGIGAYGYGTEGVKPVLTASTTIDNLKRVKAHHSIGYDGSYTPLADSNIALVGGGYYDGIMRSWVGGKVKINNRHYPIVGRVNMDTFFVDLGCDQYDVGDRVEIVGMDNPADLFCQDVHTIPYEVLTAFKGDRWERNFIL